MISNSFLGLGRGQEDGSAIRLHNVRLVTKFDIESGSAVYCLKFTVYGIISILEKRVASRCAFVWYLVFSESTPLQGVPGSTSC